MRTGTQAVRRVAAIALLPSLILLPSCVSTPGPAGPTTLMGVVPGPEIGASATALRAPGASDGPLRVNAPRFWWRHASPTAAAFAWECTVENPSQSAFEVTVVVQVLDQDSRPLASSNQGFRLAGGKSIPVSGEGVLQGEAARLVASWRIEYWVKVPPRPPRD